MPTTTIAKQKSDKVFTRLTLGPKPLRYVQRVQKQIPNYDTNDAVKMIFGLGLAELDKIMPEVDDNGFTPNTKQKLLAAKKELESGKGKVFDNVDDVMNYAKDISQ